MYGVRLAWTELPDQVRGRVGEVLGSPVVEAVSQPGGFSPGSADRVRTGDDTRAFVKAVSATQNPDSPGLHRREAGVLATLTGSVTVPQLLGSYDDGHWVALVIEDVEGRPPELPWTDAELGRTIEALAEVSHVDAPEVWPALEDELAGEFGCWQRVIDEPLLDQAEAAPGGLGPWLRQVAPELHGLARRTLPRLAGRAAAHTDLRADNILIDTSGAVRIVDWPWASRGAAWFDAVGLLINVRWSGDLDVRPHLPAIHALGATEEDVLGTLAGLAGFFVDASRRPAGPGMPTLRAFQAAQGRAALGLLRELGFDRSA